MNVKQWKFVSVLFLFVGVDTMAVDEVVFTVVNRSGVPAASLGGRYHSCDYYEEEKGV